MSKQTTQLTPISEKQVLFYEDEITAVMVEENGEVRVYVPIRPICDFLGVAFNGQRDRINRDPVLAEAVQFVRVTRTNQGGNPNMLALPLDYLSGWLFGISTRRVREEVRERLIRYQKECYRVLDEAFRAGRLTSEPEFQTLLQSNSPAAQAYKTLQALMQLARHQVMLEAKLDEHGAVLDEYGQRIEELEATLANPQRFITRQQASRLSQAVRAIGMILTKRSGSSEYGRVYGELYRRFEISSYRELPATRYDEAMNWLNEWRQGLVDDVEF